MQFLQDWICPDLIRGFCSLTSLGLQFFVERGELTITDNNNKLAFTERLFQRMQSAWMSPDQIKIKMAQ